MKFHVPVTKNELETQWKCGIMSSGEKDLYLRIREQNLHREIESGDAALYAFAKVLEFRRKSAMDRL